MCWSSTGRSYSVVGRCSSVRRRCAGDLLYYIAEHNLPLGDVVLEIYDIVDPNLARGDVLPVGDVCAGDADPNLPLMIRCA